MPGLTKANKTSELNNICTYRTSVSSGDYATPFECPSDLAIHCISDILTEISELDTTEKQIEGFHKTIEKYLNKLCLGNKSQRRIQCFWSLYEKSKITDKDIPSGSTAKDIINQAIGRANDRYHSGNLLEKLVHLEIGTGHVFDIIPHENKINFKAYSRLGMELPVIAEYFEHLLSNPDIQPFDLFIEKLVKIVKKPSANIEDLIVLVNQEIIGYCDSWKITGNAFSKTLKESNNFFKQKPINEDAVAKACAHFALICLYSTNNTFSHASYILATTFRGQSHSSMIVYWPFFSEGYSVYPHINFLLHLVLGLNSIQVKSVEKELKRTQEIKKTLKHDIKNMYINIKALYEDTLEDWSKGVLSADEKTQKRFESMHSYVMLAYHGISLEFASTIGGKNAIKPVVVSNLFHKLYYSTRFHDFEVTIKNDKEWQACEKKVDERALIPIINMINNAIRHSAGNELIELEFGEKDTACHFMVKSQAPFEKDIANRLLFEPLPEEIPATSQGFWISRKVLEQIGGKLSFEDSEKDYLTVFKISVPWIT